MSGWQFKNAVVKIGIDDALRYMVHLYGIEKVAQRLADIHGDGPIWEMLCRMHPDPRDRQMILDALAPANYVPPPVAAPSEWWCGQREEVVNEARQPARS